MNRLKIITIVGARPQFIKAAAVSRAIRRWNESRNEPAIDERIIHTGQHFDHNMSEVFFDELDIPRPHCNLGICGGGHGAMTGRMLVALEPVLMEVQPHWVLVYGDTNSTLAGALAATKLHLPVAHVEAGLRSFNRCMPEEINRILADHAGDLLFPPTAVARDHLIREGIPDVRIKCVGDVMYDAMLFYRERASRPNTIIDDLAPGFRQFILTTVHRAENTNDDDRLRGIIDGLCVLAQRIPVVLPLHPRTRLALERCDLLHRASASLRLIEPVGYLDMVRLEAHAALIATDSGGVQKEAFFNRVPCITLRDETEWTELIEIGANRLVGTDAESITAGADEMLSRVIDPADIYGDGRAGEKIVERLVNRTRKPMAPPDVEAPRAGLPAG